MLLSVLLFLLAALLPQLSLSKPKKEKRQPKEKIRIPSGIQYRYLNVIKVPYIICILIPKGLIHGHDTLPLHGENHSAIDKQIRNWI
jgi:hypothetical protein